MKKCAIYIRVSTLDQSNSVEAQQSRATEYCNYKGEFEIKRILIDQDVSGGKCLYSRPSGSELKKLIENKEIDCVVVAKIDRAFRNTVDALTTVAQWNDSGIALHVIDMGSLSIDTGSAAGKMVFGILVQFSEYERDKISERTKDVLSHKKKNLKVYSSVPFGFKNVDGNLIEIPEQQKAIQLMKEMKAKQESLRSIAKQLSLMNFKPLNGGKWHASSIKQILENPLHA